MPSWVRFQYRGFYDVPRQFLVRCGGRSFLLDCPFDVARDDYADEFDVLDFPDLAPEVVRESKDLRGLATRLLGRVAVRSVRFDPTLRSEIDLSSIPPIPANDG